MPGIGNVIEQFKKSVVFIGRNVPDKQPAFIATGCLIELGGIVHIVTAKHVVIDVTAGRLEDEGLSVFLNSRAGPGVARPLGAYKKKFKIDWVLHPNPKVDVAAFPFAQDPTTDDTVSIRPTVYADQSRLFPLYDVFHISFQPGIQEEPGVVSPIVRAGIISKINKDGTLYIDSSAFPGNSGSPVFLTPTPIRFDEGGIAVGGDTLGGRFLGIIGEYIPYQEVAVSTQTKKPRIVFEENTGLSRVWTPRFIAEVAETPEFKRQIEMLKSNQQPSAGN